MTNPVPPEGVGVFIGNTTDPVYTSGDPVYTSGCISYSVGMDPPACDHHLVQIKFTSTWICDRCGIRAEIKVQFTLSAALQDFYKSILDQPVSAEMLNDWAEMRAEAEAVREMAEKYIPLIEQEINSKVA